MPSLRGKGGTDEQLHPIRQLDSLVALGLAETSITDDGLARLTNLKNLTQLDLSGTQITDDAVDLLTEFPQLSRLDVGSTNLTERGIDRLQAPLPDLDIWDSDGPINWAGPQLQSGTQGFSRRSILMGNAAAGGLRTMDNPVGFGSDRHPYGLALSA